MNFKELSYHQQIHRLRKMARQTLELYSIRPKKLKLLCHGENTTFQVITSNAHKYTMRIHRYQYHSKKAILQELKFLGYLSEIKEIVVPGPVVGRNKKILQSIQIDEIPETRYCDLLNWVEGRFYYKGLTAKALRKVGQLTAALHRYSARLNLENFDHRPCWDINGLVGTNAVWGEIPKKARMDKRYRKAIEDTKDKIIPLLSCYNDNKKHFGLIHADLHHGNYVFDRGTPQAIDFDDFGSGYYMYDLAVTLAALSCHSRYHELKQALVQGYSEGKAPTELRLDLIEALIAARRICLLGWMWSRLEIPEICNNIPATTEKTGQWCREYIWAKTAKK